MHEVYPMNVNPFVNIHDKWLWNLLSLPPLLENFIGLKAAGDWTRKLWCCVRKLSAALTCYLLESVDSGFCLMKQERIKYSCLRELAEIHSTEEYILSRMAKTWLSGPHGLISGCSFVSFPWSEELDENEYENLITRPYCPVLHDSWRWCWTVIWV